MCAGKRVTDEAIILQLKRRRKQSLKKEKKALEGGEGGTRKVKYSRDSSYPPINRISVSRQSWRYASGTYTICELES